MLLFIDGLDKGWEETTQDISSMTMKLPFSLQRLNRHDDGDVIQKGTEYTPNFWNKYIINDKRVVRKLPLKVFQERLIHHLVILIKWVTVVTLSSVPVLQARKDVEMEARKKNFKIPIQTTNTLHVFFFKSFFR